MKKWIDWGMSSNTISSIVLIPREKLQQPTAFKPFMRTLVTFFEITCRAGKYNEVNIMAWSCFCTTQRYCVFQVIDVLTTVPFKFGKTIVTGIMLCFQFALYLVWCKGSRDRFSTGTTVTNIQAVTLSYRGNIAMVFCLNSVSLLYFWQATMSFYLDASSLLYLWSIAILFLVGLTHFSYIGTMAIGAKTLIGSRSSIVGSFLAQQSCSYFRAVTIGFLLLPHLRTIGRVVVFHSGKLSLLYFGSAVISFAFLLYFWTAKIFFLLRLSTWFAVSIKPIFGFVAAMKKIGSCRKPGVSTVGVSTLLVWCAILGYSVHDVSPLQMHPASGCFQHRRGTTLLPPYYTITPPVKLAQGVTV